MPGSENFAIYSAAYIKSNILNDQLIQIRERGKNEVPQNGISMPNFYYPV